MLFIKKLIIAFFVTTLSVMLLFNINVSANDESAYGITADGVVISAITDDNIYTYASVSTLGISSDDGVYGIYVKYDRIPPACTVEANGEIVEKIDTGFLHQFIEVDGQKNISLYFDTSAVIADVYVFNSSDTPAWVQKWQLLDKADIMICPTHSDDDQLYFAGMIPWCVANGYRAQVVYFTNHWNTHERPHELLDGLWTCGLNYYPYISSLPDLYCIGEEEAYGVFGYAGYTVDDFTSFYVELFEKYNPLVVACHDLNGEYGHGAHIINTKAVIAALALCEDEGLWNVPKTYIHLYGENSVTLDWDEPLEYFGGKSAFSVSQEAFRCHKSQHRFNSLYSWIYGDENYAVTEAKQIHRYSPCAYGLYRTTVGYDTETNGLFEHITTYGERERIAAVIKNAACLFGESARLSALERFKPINEHLPITSTDRVEQSSDFAESVSSAASGSGNTDSSAGFIVVSVSCLSLFAIMYNRYKRRKNGK